jgi:hypothetical protein
MCILRFLCIIVKLILQNSGLNHFLGQEQLTDVEFLVTFFVQMKFFLPLTNAIIFFQF